MADLDDARLQEALAWVDEIVEHEKADEMPSFVTHVTNIHALKVLAASVRKLKQGKEQLEWDYGRPIVLSARLGDVVLLGFEDHLSKAQQEAMIAQMKGCMPGVRFVIVERLRSAIVVKRSDGSDDSDKSDSEVEEVPVPDGPGLGVDESSYLGG